MAAGHGGGFGGYHGGIGHLGHYGYYNSHAYLSRYLYYPFSGGGYPWYDYQPYYGWGFSSGMDNSPTYSTLLGPDIPGYSGDSAADKPDNSAHVSVRLPADAEIWFNGTKMTQTGPEREFYSPELKPGRSYSYDVRVRWKKYGHEVTQTLKIGVSAGAWVPVDFPLPTATETRAKAETEP
jgi:uncharacterized protein (TIGR03000 family)